MSVEELKRCTNSYVKSILDEREVETLEKAAHLADEYTLTNKVFFLLTRQILKKHLTHLQVLNPVLVSSLVIPIRIIENPKLLLKTKSTTPYLAYLQLLQVIR